MLQSSRRSLLSINRLVSKEDALSVRGALSGQPWICASCRHRTSTSQRLYTQAASSQVSSSDYGLDDRALASSEVSSKAESLPLHFQRSAFLPSDFALPPSTLLVPKERLKPVKQDPVPERSTTMSNNQKRKLQHSKPSKIPQNLRDVSLQTRVIALKLALKPALYTSTMSERRLRIVAMKYHKAINIWYKHARHSVPLHTTGFSDQVTLPNGTRCTVQELCIQLLCRYYAKIKDAQRNHIFRFYETLRNGAPELLAPFQQSVILAMTQENDLHQAKTWARRFINEGNLVSAAFLTPVIARLIQAPFGLGVARSLAEDAFKLTGVDADVAYLVCIGIAKSSDTSDLPALVEQYAAHQESFPQERFVNILYNLALRGHNGVVIDLYMFWRSHLLKAQDESEKEELQKSSATIYTIVLKAILNRYPSATNAAPVRDSRSRLLPQLTQLLENMTEDGIELDGSMVPSLIAGLGSAKEMNLAMQTAHFALRMDKGKVNYDAIVKTIVRILLDEGRRDEAEALLKKVGGSETISTHNLIIRMILNYDNFDNLSVPTPEAFSDAMKHFKELPVKPDRITAKSMMIAALRLEDTKAAFEVLTMTGQNGEPHLWHSLLVHITRDIYKRTTKAVTGQGSTEGLQESIGLLQRVVIAAIELWTVPTPRKYEVNQAFKEIFRPSLLRGILGVHFLPIRPSVRVDFDQGRRDMEGMLDILRAGKVTVDHGTVEAVVKKAVDGKLIRLVR